MLRKWNGYVSLLKIFFRVAFSALIYEVYLIHPIIFSMQRHLDSVYDFDQNVISLVVLEIFELLNCTSRSWKWRCGCVSQMISMPTYDLPISKFDNLFNWTSSVHNHSSNPLVRKVEIPSHYKLMPYKMSKLGMAVMMLPLLNWLCSHKSL